MLTTNNAGRYFMKGKTFTLDREAISGVRGLALLCLLLSLCQIKLNKSEGRARFAIRSPALHCGDRQDLLHVSAAPPPEIASRSSYGVSLAQGSLA